MTDFEHACQRDCEGDERELCGSLQERDSAKEKSLDCALEGFKASRSFTESTHSKCRIIIFLLLIVDNSCLLHSSVVYTSCLARDLSLALARSCGHATFLHNNDLRSLAFRRLVTSVNKHHVIEQEALTGGQRERSI